MTHHVALAGHPPLPVLSPRPRHRTRAAPPVLWAQLDLTQQHQIAALIAELTQRMTMTIPLRPREEMTREEMTDDHC